MGADDWLDHAIANDLKSEIMWRRQRAAKLDALRAGNRLPIADLWPAGPCPDQRTDRQLNNNEAKRSEAFAHHWWSRYWEAETDEEAYAAWELFCRCADRRSVLCMQFYSLKSGSPGNSNPRRVPHFELNYEELKSKFDKTHKEANSEFLGRKIADGIGPWGKVRYQRPDRSASRQR